MIRGYVEVFGVQAILLHLLLDVSSLGSEGYVKCVLFELFPQLV